MLNLVAYVYCNICFKLYLVGSYKYYSKEYSLIGKIGSFKLQISSSSLGALVIA